MDSAGPHGSNPGEESSPHVQRPCRAYVWGLSCGAADKKESWFCRYFHRGFCFHGDGCSFQHPRTPSPPEWGRCHSEPHVTLLGPGLGLTRRSSEPTYLPSATGTVGCGWAGARWGPKSGLVGLASSAQGVGSSFWKSLCPSSADRHPCRSPGSQPQPDPAQELAAPLQHLNLEGQQDSRDVVCGICMDRVWDKPEAQRVFAILPNCTHAHCLGCLRTWRSSGKALPPEVIKACPQCRVHSSYIIPHKSWVSEAAAKEQLIGNFKAWTSQIHCRFFLRGNGRCPFKADCIYLHQLPAEASSPPWPGGVQLASGSEVVTGLRPASFFGATEPEQDVFLPDCALTLALWGSQLLLAPNMALCSQDQPEGLGEGQGSLGPSSFPLGGQK